MRPVLVRLLLLCIVLLAVGVFVAIRTGTLIIPNRFNPWAALDLSAEPNFLTRFKLARLSKDPMLCARVLATSGFDYAPIPNGTTGYGCGFHNAVRIARTAVLVGEPFALSCRTAVSLALWERHGLQPTAAKYFQQRVERIEHFGSYACRNVYGRPEATRSRHATAEALDVVGFVLEDGTLIRVVNGWDAEVRGDFLRELRDAACLFFDGVLSPAHNEAHADHFHLDRGPHRVCR